jgi:Las1-like
MASQELHRRTRLTPWSSWEEWHTVYAWLRGFPSQSDAHSTTQHTDVQADDARDDDQAEFGYVGVCDSLSDDDMADQPASVVRSAFGQCSSHVSAHTTTLLTSEQWRVRGIARVNVWESRGRAFLPASVRSTADLVSLLFPRSGLLSIPPLSYNPTILQWSSCVSYARLSLSLSLPICVYVCVFSVCLSLRLSLSVECVSRCLCDVALLMQDRISLCVCST